MALQLYRAGNSHTVRGVVCALKNVEQHELIDALGDGWYRSEKEIDGIALPEPDIAVDEPKTKAEEEAEFRAIAKELGIKNWHNKKIDTLMAELEEFNEQT